MNNEDFREFVCNTLLIKALLPYLTIEDRRKTRDWLNKLQNVEECEAEYKLRNEYAFCLLINVQNGSLLQPFNKTPSVGKLKPLCRVLPDYLYEDAMKQIKISSCKLNKMLNANNDNYELPDLRCEPASFHKVQPRPKKGITALVAAFSNYEDDFKNSQS